MSLDRQLMPVTAHGRRRPSTEDIENINSYPDVNPARERGQSKLEGFQVYSRMFIFLHSLSLCLSLPCSLSLSLPSPSPSLFHSLSLSLSLGHLPRVLSAHQQMHMGNVGEVVFRVFADVLLSDMHPDVHAD